MLLFYVTRDRDLYPVPVHRASDAIRTRLPARLPPLLQEAYLAIVERFLAEQQQMMDTPLHHIDLDAGQAVMAHGTAAELAVRHLAGETRGRDRRGGGGRQPLHAGRQQRARLGQAAGRDTACQTRRVWRRR